MGYYINTYNYILSCRLDLLPIYSRLVATLDPCAPDIAPEMIKQLKSEFRFRVTSILLASNNFFLAWRKQVSCLRLFSPLF